MLGSILVGKKAIISVSRTAPISEIVALLYEHRIGAVLVMEGDSMEGLVSERDICRCLHIHGPAILGECAEDIMTSPVVTAPASLSVCDAMEIMTDRRFRHLPVTDNGRLVGLVSIGDLVKRRIEDAEAEAAAMKQYIAS